MAKTMLHGRVGKLATVAGLMLAVHTSSSAQSVQVHLLHYERAAQNVTYDAVCVVTHASSDRPSNERAAVCHYISTNEAVYRDDTSVGNGALRQKPSSDTTFSNWFSGRLGPAAEKCNLPSLFASIDWKAVEQLKQSCSKADIQTRSLHGLAPKDFQEFATMVRADVEKQIGALNANIGADTENAVLGTGPPETTGGNANNTGPSRGNANNTGPSGTTGATGTSGSTGSTGDAGSLPNRRDWLLWGITAGIAFLVTKAAMEMLFRWRYRKSSAAEFLRKTAGHATTLASIVGELLREKDDALTANETLTRSYKDPFIKIQALLSICENGDVPAVVVQSVERARACEIQLRKWADASSGAPLSNEEVIKQVGARLDELAQIRKAIGTRADGTSINQYVRHLMSLNDRFRQSQFWNKPAGPKDMLDAVTEVENRVGTLYGRCNLGPASSAVGVLLELIEEKMIELEGQKQEAEQVLDIVRPRAQSGETLPAALRRELDDLTAGREFVQQQWPGSVKSTDLKSVTPQLRAQMKTAREDAKQLGCDGTQDLDALLRALVQSVRNERGASVLVKNFNAILCSYLKLPEIDLPTLVARTGDEFNGRRHIVRLCLVAAVPELERIAKESDLAGILKLSEIRTYLQTLVGQLIDCDDRTLWSVKLKSGFAQDWLHFLFRAEAVARTYFAWSELADVLTVIAWSIRLAMSVSGISLENVRLLQPAPADSEQVNVSPEFRLHPDIRRCVQARLEQIDTPFVVDIRAFGIQSGNSAMSRSSVVLSKQTGWRD